MLAAQKGDAVELAELPAAADGADECGWVSRSDPLLHAPLLLQFSRVQYGVALRSLACPALLLHARTSASSRDRTFVAHIDTLLAGSSSCDPAEPGHCGGSSSGVRDVVADRLLQLEPDSVEEVAGFVGEFVRDSWNNRANIRRDAEQAHAEQVALNKRVRVVQKEIEAAFYAGTPPAIGLAKL